MTSVRDVGERFIVALRMNEGVDQETLRELCESIRNLGASWRDRDMVPKEDALVLAELYPAIDACAPLYQGTERQAIIDASALVWEAVTHALDSE